MAVVVHITNRFYKHIVQNLFVGLIETACLFLVSTSCGKCLTSQKGVTHTV